MLKNIEMNPKCLENIWFTDRVVKLRVIYKLSCNYA